MDVIMCMCKSVDDSSHGSEHADESRALLFLFPRHGLINLILTNFAVDANNRVLSSNKYFLDTIMKMERKLAEEVIRKSIIRSRNYVCGIDLQEKKMTSETYLRRLSALMFVKHRLVIVVTMVRNC